MNPTAAIPSSLAERLDAAATGRSFMVALAGPPGAGKSTLGEALVAGRGAALVPMDGFHLDNRLLDAAGLRHRKGAPRTFDAAGCLALLARLRAGEDVVAPLFDRERDLAIAGALAVPGDAPLIVVEGNYLLLDRPVWRDIAALFDLTVMIDPGEAVLERRLVKRWLDHGHDLETAKARAADNDLVNARTVLRESLPPDLRLTGEERG